MKRIAAGLLAAVLVGSLAFADAALAHDRSHRSHRSHFGLFIDIPVYAPWVHRPYYGYYPPPVLRAPPAPPVYIERSTAPGPENYWYFCGSVGGYYPYVKECPEGWQKVVPQPPPG